MKKSIVLLLVMFMVGQAGFSQLRFHVMGGFANYSGDLQQKRFTLNQAKGVIAAGATYDLTNKFSIRSEYSFAKLSAADKFSEKSDLRKRNLDFTTLLKEVTLMGEYNLFDVAERPLTPYVFGGISVFKYSPYTTTAAGEKVFLMGLSTEGQGLPQYPDRKDYKKVQMALPFGGGLKYALSEDVHLGVELGIRKLFTDYLDDVSTTYIDENVLRSARGPIAADLAFRGDEIKDNPLSYPAEGTVRGGKAKDLFYFGQVRISFRMPWFDGSGGGRRGKYGCPRNVL